MKAEFTQNNGLDALISSLGRDSSHLVKGDISLSPFLQIIENMIAGMENSEDDESMPNNLLGESLVSAEGLFTDDGDEDDSEEETNKLMENISYMLNPIPINVKQISLEELQLISDNNKVSSDFEESMKLDVNILSNVNEKVIENNAKIPSNIAQSVAQSATSIENVHMEAVSNTEEGKFTPVINDEYKKQENLDLPKDFSKAIETKAIEPKAGDKSSLISKDLRDGDFESEKSSLKAQKPITASENDGIRTKQQFARTIDTVKNQLKEESSTNEKTETKQSPVSTLDFDNTFERIDLSSGKIIAKKLDPQMESPKLTGQIKTEITNHLIKGDKEFTMRLKPEELGEITIRMVKTGEKVTVDIVAANPKTVQLLNTELGALRDVLKPMQAEVRTVVSADSSDGFKSMQDSNMSGQGFLEQQNRWNQRENKPSYYGDGAHFEEEALSTVATENNGKLKVYI